MSSVEDIQAVKWLDRAVRKIVDEKFKEMGIPQLFLHGVVKSISQIPASSGKYFADVYLNGSSTAATNIPVNPTEAANIAANTPVFVLRVNFDQTDLYVLCRKLA